MNKLGIRRKFYSKRIEKEPDRILTFTAEQANSTIKLAKNGSPAAISLQYSTNGGRTWNTYTIGNTITLANIGDNVKFKGENSSFSSSTSNYYIFQMTGKIAASGDVTSLLNGLGGDVALPRNYCYYYMFKACTSLVTAPNLPATTLASWCYTDMFNGCTHITSHHVAKLGSDYRVFEQNTSCESFTIDAETPPTIAFNTITGLKADCVIYVPAGSVEAYKSADYWSARAAYIQAIPNT